MEKITETKRWKHWEDELARVEYRKIMGLDFVYIKPKDKKIQMAILLYGKDKKYWQRMKSRNLSGLLKSK